MRISYAGVLLKSFESLTLDTILVVGALAKADIHQLNLIMEILGTPRDEFMQKISSESVSGLVLSRFAKRTERYF